MASTVTDIFTGSKTQRDLTQYTLMRGVTDFGNLSQFNLFETGYSFLIVVSIPKFMTELAKVNTNYQNLINTYVHILEYEFKGLEGLESMETDTSEISNGISTLNVITKVTLQSASKFAMKYMEKSGSTITKTHELYLRCLKDPRTQVKTYGGLIADGTLVADYANEVFSFLYFVTDNSLQNIERAVYIVSAQPTGAELEMYNSQKGEIEFKEISVEFNGYPITGPAVVAKAATMLTWLNANTVFDENKYTYTGVSTIAEVSATTSTVT